MRWRRAGVLVGLLTGCGGSKFDGTQISISTDLVYPEDPTLGNVMSVEMKDAWGKCPLSSSATLAINGQLSGFGACWAGNVDTFLGNPPFTLQVTDGDDHAEMIVDELAPGADVTVGGPVNGQVSAGATLTISLPSAFQGQSALYAEFLNTDLTDSYAGTQTSPTYLDPLAGAPGLLEIPAPQHPASYTLLVWMNGAPVGALAGQVVACTGFARCSAQAVDALGPATITVTP